MFSGAEEGVGEVGAEVSGCLGVLLGVGGW